MSRNAKIALIILGTLTVICLGLCGIGYFLLPRLAQNVVSQKPEDAKRVGAEIADYTLPEGYQEFMGMNFLVYKMVMIAPARDDGQIRNGMAFMLLGMDFTGGNQADMERQMQQSFQQQYGRSGSTMKYVGTETATIRDKHVTLTIAESEGGSATLRQAIGTFEGKNGLVMVMVMGDVDEWDDSLMREFLGSIK